MDQEPKDRLDEQRIYIEWYVDKGNSSVLPNPSVSVRNLKTGELTRKLNCALSSVGESVITESIATSTSRWFEYLVDERHASLNGVSCFA